MGSERRLVDLQRRFAAHLRDQYARQAGRHLATLRNQVTSPGGTSAEALYQIDKGGLRTVMSRAIWQPIRNRGAWPEAWKKTEQMRNDQSL